MEIKIVKPRKAASILGVSESTLKKLRLSKKLIENIHYRKLNGRIVYFKELLENYLLYGDNNNHLTFCTQFKQLYDKGKVKATFLE